MFQKTTSQTNGHLPSNAANNAASTKQSTTTNTQQKKVEKVQSQKVEEQLKPVKVNSKSFLECEFQSWNTKLLIHSLWKAQFKWVVCLLISSEVSALWCFYGDFNYCF